MMAIEKLLIKYADAYDAEKAASEAFSKAMHTTICREILIEETRLKAKGEMHEYSSLNDERFSGQLSKIKSEALEEHQSLWRDRRNKRAILGAAKRSMIMRARALRKASQ